MKDVDTTLGYPRDDRDVLQSDAVPRCVDSLSGADGPHRDDAGFGVRRAPDGSKTGPEAERAADYLGAVAHDCAELQPQD